MSYRKPFVQEIDLTAASACCGSSASGSCSNPPPPQPEPEPRPEPIPQSCDGLIAFLACKIA